MNTETISFLKKNAANLPLEEPLVITQNGIPAYVVESYQDRHRRDEAIALLKLISFSKQDVQKERVSSVGDFKDRLAVRKRNLKESNNNEPNCGRN
ncbi:type II toxin-antitoxin system Phd/YefM family antitoxin [Vibrio campbellii]|uniref:type II toxin-antitoxin system Phd/YefM family antitoxin n=1 Tax=Vibrio campbellii TaxID=680 RepID=UPI00210D167F|nr:type II toxin-antitoxin system Phd/YefM family antitoxin [Vibrio campbellii]UTZ44536.1 type II toxin-antitoxin system Phd/YefM family antitoxin [Vibrio campbellii]